MGVDILKLGAIVVGMETTTSTKFAFIHIEWWDARKGSDILWDVLKAVNITDGCHVYNRDALAVTGAEFGEMDLYISIPVDTVFDYEWAVYAIREAGMRVKTAMFLGDRFDIATGTTDDVWAYFDREIGME